MAKVAALALASLLCLTACRSLERKPVEVDTPAVQHHFIVMTEDGKSPAPVARPRARVAGDDRG